MRFSDVRHQDRALAILRRALRSGRTPHAYLFVGPDGVGKELAARALAGRLLCGEPTGDPAADACGRCAACRLLAADGHPDFHLIHRGLHRLHRERTVRQSKGLYLVVDVIRHFVIEPAALKPAQGPRRVFVIRDAERMNDEAQNALLKTLEEPPGTAVLILLTTAASRLLPTIRSRCQEVPFGLLPTEFVASELTTRLHLKSEAAQTLARLSDGRLGVALRWHQRGLLSALDAVGATLDHVTAGDPEGFARALVDAATALAVPEADAETDPEEAGVKAGARKVATDELRDALKIVLVVLAGLFRDALVLRAEAHVTPYVPPLRARAERWAAERSADELDSDIRSVTHAEQLLDRNVAPQLAGEWLAVALRGEAPVP